MPRTIWTKLQSDPNGAWNRNEGELPFSIPLTDGVAYDVLTDTGESFVMTPSVSGGGSVTISGLFASDQAGSGEVVVSYSISANSAVAGVLTTTPNVPSAAQILAGNDHNDAPAPSMFTDNWTTTGSDSLPNLIPDIATDTYYIHVLPSGGSDASVVSSNGFSLETVSPFVALGVRHHVLVSVWNDDTNMTVRAYIWDVTSGTWNEASNVTDGSANGANLALGAHPIRLFTRSDGSSQNSAGNVNRVVMWTSTAPAPITDIGTINV